ncbi:hypothetical protein FKM82_015700 [Ascaphus truei]
MTYFQDSHPIPQNVNENGQNDLLVCYGVRGIRTTLMLSITAKIRKFHPTIHCLAVIDSIDCVPYVDEALCYSAKLMFLSHQYVGIA